MKPKLLFVALTILFGLASFGSAKAQKQVDFVHGLNGNSNTWGYYDYFKNKYNASFRKLDYSSKGVNGISDIANNLSYVSDLNPSKIGVGHSMGGLVIKELIRKYSSTTTYGGFITIGTPHRGALIANAMDNGKRDAFFKRSKNKIFVPVWASVSYGKLGNPISLLKWAIGGIGFISFADNLIAYLLSLVDDEYPAPLRNDLKEGSKLTKSLLKMSKVTGDNNFPMVTIYGEEKDKALYRLIAGKGKATALWGLVKFDEPTVIGVFKSIEHAYFALGLAYNALGVTDAALAILNFWNPSIFLFLARSASAFWVGSEFNDTGHYFKNDIHNEWSHLIGAYRTEHHTYVYYKWVCSQINRRHPNFHYWNHNYHKFDDPFLYRVGFCTKGKMTKSIKHYTLRIRESSDGLLNKTTQNDLDTRVHLKAEDANHREQTKHYSVKEHLKDLFEGRVKKGNKLDYFKLK